MQPVNGQLPLYEIFSGLTNRADFVSPDRRKLDLDGTFDFGRAETKLSYGPNCSLSYTRQNGDRGDILAYSDRRVTAKFFRYGIYLVFYRISDPRSIKEEREFLSGVKNDSNLSLMDDLLGAEWSFDKDTGLWQKTVELKIIEDTEPFLEHLIRRAPYLEEESTLPPRPSHGKRGIHKKNQGIKLK